MSRVFPTCDELKRMTASGMTVKDISAKTGTATTAIYVLLKAYGILTDKARQSAKDRVDRIKECIDQGMTRRQVAAFLGMNYGRLCALSKELFPDWPLEITRTPERAQQVKTLAASGLCASEIARRLGISRERVYQINKEHNLGIAKKRNP